MSTAPPPPCFVCDGDDQRRLFDKKGRQFWACRRCGLQKQHPLPSPAELNDYYEKSYGSGMYQEFAAAGRLKDLTAERRLHELRGEVPLAGRWLDVGASTGNFSKAAAALGIQAEGVELSDTAVETARSQGVVMHAGDLAEMPAEACYDCITAFDLIEHVLDPPALVDEARRRLVDGGHLVMTLPDLGAPQRRLMGSRWYFYIPEEHLHYFTRGVMRRFLEGRGFEVLKTRATYKPMTFDYAQTQFKEYNPAIHAILRVAGAVAPRRLKQSPIPLPIGEMAVVARKRG
ncbi:bifunctional 3-demethylubiquinone-9 3-methyltransferase/ 2-octaprenyl-6-hydroxy phenol methylase [Botrimarina colliarenosi]|uniref:Bifunctional 3-demethylubiquinone-9 3-methyltransferase/ 2-octaprenyl-6-hydroxy phenol methylase n=1 Tax=Botrimarina colliarenosi TaxID=2528001 RepID=A0A5C6AIN1_9BACT|nr:class I SAM-dependent methyltransferase [Botrimarina colliarenosi]TWT98093.1 bifunctional 3-demethylubiquinone-9 3-methyltransferase/ 2-octaprenyl-6-hydroxy phenol methylase [Botrimarina colliarenosi]